MKTRDLIIKEAERLIVEHGVDGLKLEDIANSLAIQRPTLYFHYKGRDGILAAIAERGTIHLCNQFQDDRDKDPVEAIREGIEDMVLYMREHKAFTLLMARNLSKPEGIPAFDTLLDDTKSQSVPLVAGQLFKRLGNIIQRGCRAGIFEPIDSELFWTIMVNLVGVCIIFPGRQIRDINKMMTRFALGMLKKQ